MHPTATSSSANSPFVSGYPGTATPQQPGRIEEAVATGSGLLETLHREIADLDNRMTGVLRPIGPPNSAPDSVRPAKAEPSRVATSIELMNSHIENAIAYVRSLNARVDL